MATLRAVERRHEPRSQADLGLLVWCIETKGARFLQEARAREISLSGARLSGLDAELSPGDVIGILYAGKKARYQVIWVRESGPGHKIQAAVYRIAPDECPWGDLLKKKHAGDPAVSQPAR